MYKKILIIGGLGFIGKNLYLELKNRGYSQVDIFSNANLSSDDPFFKLFENELIIGTIENETSLNLVVPNYDVVFSLAGVSGASQSILHPFRDIDINLKGHLNILEACKKSKNRIKIIFPSSRLVYGTPDYLPVDEKHPIKPNSIYAIHKYTTEQYYLLYSQFYNIESVVLRISNPYGPYQSNKTHNYGILNNFILKALKKQDIHIYGEGNQKRDFIFVGDLADLLAKFIEKDRPGIIFNIGSHLNFELIEIIKIIKECIPDLKYEHVPWPEIDKKIETGNYLSDISKIENTFNWLPATNIRIGIKETINFYKNNLKFYEK